ncbi:TolC family protein [Bacteroidia bacterium]|nr:TolC family protein [Bacteroidia bacterium]
MKHILNIILIGLISPFAGSSQSAMTLEDAIAIALKNNYDIQLAENSKRQADNNQSIYNTGFLPTFNASGNANYSNSNTSFTTQQGVDNTINGAEIKSLGTSVGLNYVLFNGGARKFQFDRLKKQYLLASSQKKLQIENTLIEVYTLFLNIARNQEQKKTLDTAFSISKSRLERTKIQQKYGQRTTLDVLNAKVDANNDSINLINLQVQLDNNKRNLNFLLGRDISTMFLVNNQVVLDPNMSLDRLKTAMDSNNVQLKQIELNKQISNHDLNINKAAWVPSLSASASYGLDYRDNGKVGFFQNQNSAGLNAGVNLSWDIFDGGANKVRVQNARINLENQSLNEQKLKLSLENQLAIFWAEYTTQMTLISNETINVKVNEQNFLKSQEQFNLGQISSLDFRQAQLNLIQTKLNLLNASYNAKLAEFQLKRFAGLLLEQ